MNGACFKLDATLNNHTCLYKATAINAIGNPQTGELSMLLECVRMKAVTPDLRI